MDDILGQFPWTSTPSAPDPNPTPNPKSMWVVCTCLSGDFPDTRSWISVQYQGVVNIIELFVALW